MMIKPMFGITNLGLIPNLVEIIGDPHQDEPGMVLVEKSKTHTNRSNHEEIIERQGITVNEESSKKAPALGIDLTALGIDLKEIDLQSVIKMGLEEVMFQAGLIAVQQLIEAEVEKLAKQFSKPGAMNKAVMAKMLAGVSTRAEWFTKRDMFMTEAADSDHCLSS